MNIKLIALLSCGILSACSAPYHHAAMYKNGQLVAEETDFNPSIGGVHSQKGADGYQADDDNQKSLADTINGIGVYSGFKYGFKTQDSNNNVKNVSVANQTTQLKNASDAASTDLKTTTAAATKKDILTVTGKGPPGKNFPAPVKTTTATP